jgi:hypothetical protein
MGIAMLALSGLLKNLSFSSFQPKNAPKRQTGRIHPAWAQRQGTCPLPIAAPTRALPAPRQLGLRVLRVQETGQTAPEAGRMVISGRMADVCAELDRLVALEGRQLRT